jgi:hypothetical protein
MECPRVPREEAPRLRGGAYKKAGPITVQEWGGGAASFAAEGKRVRSRPRVFLSPALRAWPGISIATGQGSRDEVRKRRSGGGWLGLLLRVPKG